jgi:hypothetical protein
MKHKTINNNEEVSIKNEVLKTMMTIHSLITQIIY